ncbi:MAG: hypothetical protein AMXMBFR59_14000 [Rhodanobacteraceae bacterium]
MNWLLVVFVLNTPVKTDLVFNSLDACLSAETEMRSQWAEAYNRAAAAKAQQASLDMIKSQMSRGTCIPAK